jgi:hypothetical protein
MREANRIYLAVTHAPARALMLIGLLCMSIGCATAARRDLRYEGYSVIAGANPATVDAVVTVRNDGSKIAKIPPSACPIRLLAFGDPERMGQPIWKSGPETCISSGMIRPPFLVGPGDFFEFRVRTDVPRWPSTSPIFLSMTVPGRGLVPVGQLPPWFPPPNTR